MRILHELNQLEKGGAERVVESIIKHDRENKHIVYSYKDGPMKSVLESAGAEVLIQSDETVDMDCDIIHIHTGGSSSLMASCVKGNLPTVETVHSPIASGVRDEWVTQRIGVSNVVTKKNRKCKTIYNGIDTDRLQSGSELEKSFRETYNIPSYAFVVGRIGRVATDKCFEEWLMACKKFQDMGISGDRAYFVIIGDEASTSKGYLAKVKVMAHSLPLKNIIFVPAIENIGWALKDFDVFMYPSPTEGFGLVYMEAMACGVPTILWDNELTKELCLGSAVLCENNVKDLAENLAYLFLNDGVRNQFAEQGQKSVLSGFTAEIMSNQYQELYKALKREPANA